MIRMSKTLRIVCLAATFAAAAGLAMPPVAIAAAKMSDAEKKAKAKECSDKADAQKLHGAARKTFREKCKRGES
jgi:hypothetical protein